MAQNVLLREDTPEMPRAIACAIFPQGGERECEVSLGELERLLDTAGAALVATVVQLSLESMLPSSTMKLNSGVPAE